MLTISRLRDSAAAVSYYEKDDYYTAGTDSSASGAQGQWWGAAARRLGLSGAVWDDVVNFFRSLVGLAPNSPTV